jgi:hypothetical protein
MSSSLVARPGRAFPLRIAGDYGHSPALEASPGGRRATDGLRTTRPFRRYEAMLRRPVLSLVLAATLLLALAVPSAAASARGPLPLDLGSFWGQAWGWLTSLLPHADAAIKNFPPPSPDAGCEIDPNGRCLH